MTNPVSHAAAPPVFRALIVASHAKDHVQMGIAAKPFFEALAAEHGFAVTFTDDYAAVTAENLAAHDVFVMLHLAPFDMSTDSQAALQAFIERGGGWVGVHAAGLTGRQFIGGGKPYWEWFETFLGGITYSPHPRYQTGEIVLEDRTHPATRNLPERFSMGDEWYEFNESPRGRVRVLAAADESTYTPKIPMGDHPIIWVNEAYRRAIYIGVGHDDLALQNPAFATLLRDSVLWAGEKA